MQRRERAHPATREKGLQVCHRATSGAGGLRSTERRRFFSYAAHARCTRSHHRAAPRRLLRFALRHGPSRPLVSSAGSHRAPAKPEYPKSTRPLASGATCARCKVARARAATLGGSARQRTICTTIRKGVCGLKLAVIAERSASRLLLSCEAHQNCTYQARNSQRQRSTAAKII